MPIYFNQKLNENQILCIWKIEETVKFYCDYLQVTENQLEQLSNSTHPQKQIEWLASRTCLKFACGEMGINFLGVEKDEFSNPCLVNHSANISITHSEKFAAISIDLKNDVGIDIEKISNKLERVASRFLSKKELDNLDGNTEQLGVYWCAKESLYKWYGKKRMSLREHIYIRPFVPMAKTIKGEIDFEQIKTCLDLNVYYFEDYILTVTSQ